MSKDARDFFFVFLLAVAVVAAVAIGWMAKENTLHSQPEIYLGRVGFQDIPPELLRAGDRVTLCATAPSEEVLEKVKFIASKGKISQNPSNPETSLPLENGCAQYTAAEFKSKGRKEVWFDKIELVVEGERTAEISLPIFTK